MAVGLTQASSVIPFVRSRLFASATVTQSFTPSNDSAPPDWPPVTQDAPEIVPVCPPTVLAAVVPDPSSNVKYATRPLPPGAFTVTVVV